MIPRHLPPLTALTLIAGGLAGTLPALAHAHASAAWSRPAVDGVRLHATATPRARPTQKPGTPAATGTPTPSPARARPTATITPSSAPVQMSEAAFSLYTFNPQYFRQQVSFALSAPARVRVRIAPAGQTAHPTHVRTMNLGVRRAGTVQLSWDGRDNAHRLVPAGPYTYTLIAINAKGQRQTDTYSPLSVTYKRIVVSLSQQRLTAYDGSKEFLTTLVTTGNPALPTPTGTFAILAKYHPFTFVSPWPPGSKYYYPPSPVTYAMLFNNGGYYIHDAPWRSHYGPGSNAQVGTPGTNYTGSHGCVNVPFPAEQRLFAWAPVGTAVVIVR